MKRIPMLWLVCLMIVLPALPGGAEQKVYRAKLSGAQEVPKVKTPARGNLKIIYTGGAEMSFQLNVDRITSPTAAHIHRGKKGENGPPLAGLFGGPVKMGKFKRILAEGVISEQSLMGELEGKMVADLAKLMDSGETYVDVLTVTYPLGEMRGQIK